MIETPRLVLRPLTPDDAAYLSERFGGAAARRLEGAPQARRAFGLRAVVGRREEALLGCCGLWRQPDVAGRDEVEIWGALLPAYRGCGCATEAVRACRDEAFDRIGLERLIALIDPADVAARRVAEKVGMRLEREVAHGGRRRGLYVVRRGEGRGRPHGPRPVVAAPCYVAFRLTR